MERMDKPHIYLATDHAGFELKTHIRDYLEKEGYQVTDFGAHQYEPSDDYPDFISQAAEAVSKNPDSLGIIFGASGQAEAMLANKFVNVRAALFYAEAIPFGVADINDRVSEDPLEMIRLTREHNNANILSIGARFVKPNLAEQVVKKWIETPFSGDERHVRRIHKIALFERSVS
jgi:ribose 5-phosphate isomerase B